MRHKYSSFVGLNDLLFNVLVGFVFLFVIAFLMINPPTKKADIPTKAEFMIVLEWDEESEADIDLWIQRDDNDKIGYNNKESSVLHLERDDLGRISDTVNINGEISVVKVNREVITIRGIVPGEYFVGIHYYKSPGSTVDSPEDTIIKGRVTFMDVNPYVEVYAKEFTMENQGSKINMPAVTIDAEGTVTAIYAHTKNLGPDVKNPESENYNYGRSAP